VKKNKKIKTKVLITKIPKKKRGRPCKEKTVKIVKVKRIKKVMKVKETKRDKMQKVAVLGKRKYKKAVEQMALDKINKKIRRKGRANNRSVEHGEAVSVRTYSYESQSPISAGPDKAPVGINNATKKETLETPVIPIVDFIKGKLTEKGYHWKPDSFKVVEKTPAWWTVEFVDKKKGEITSSFNILQAKQEEDIATGKLKKDPKLSKVELNRYIKKLKEHGRNPQDIKVIENKADYFTIEFRDGLEGPVTTCSHAKGWE